MPIPVVGGPRVPIDVLRRALESRAIADYELIAETYTELGHESGLGNLMPFAQAVKECAWFRDWKWVKNNNPTGLGSFTRATRGYVFETKEQGIRASFGHLLGYALTDLQACRCQAELMKSSPRLSVLSDRGYRGIAKVWADLNGRWAWPGTTYGQSIERLAMEISQS